MPTRVEVARVDRSRGFDGASRGWPRASRSNRGVRIGHRDAGRSRLSRHIESLRAGSRDMRRCRRTDRAGTGRLDGTRTDEQ